MIGVDRSRHPARGRTPERCRSTEGPAQAIQLPPLRSPKDGPPQRLTLDPRGPCPGETAAYASQEEDTVRRSRPEAAIGSGLPPIVLRIMFANGQPSTDSVRARRHEAYGSSGTGATSAVKPKEPDEQPLHRQLTAHLDRSRRAPKGTGVAELDPQLSGLATMRHCATPPTGRSFDADSDPRPRVEFEKRTRKRAPTPQVISDAQRPDPLSPHLSDTRS